MNTPGLFIVGAGVTLIVVAAIAILLYGAVLDGRDERAEQARADVADGEPVEAGTR